MLLGAAGRLRETAGALGEVLGRELGLTTAEAIREISAAERSFLAAAASTEASSASIHPVGAESAVLPYRAPVGVAALLTGPFPPVSGPAALLAHVLGAGNTAVWKPSGHAAETAVAFLRVALDEFPPGVVNLVHGTAAGTGAGLVAHPDVRLALASGREAACRSVAERAASLGKRSVLFPGRKSAAVVLDDADLEGAVAGVLQGAFAFAGQAPDALGRVLAHRRIARALAERVSAAAEGMRVAGGDPGESQMGPVVTRERRDGGLALLAAAVRSGARVLAGGGSPPPDGWYLRPAVFDEVRPSLPCVGTDEPVPVVSMMTVDSLEEAIHVLNHTLPALSSSLYTRDVARVHRTMRDLEVARLWVNAQVPGSFAAGSTCMGPLASGGGHISWIDAVSEGRAAILQAGPRPSAGEGHTPEGAS